MTPSASTRIASISKAFNGAVVLSLVSQGKLSLDAKLATLLPTAPASWGQVNLGQILQHTSGLPDYIKSPAFIEQFVKDPKASKTPEQLLTFVADQPPAFPPGSQYLYSDTDNIVAGLVAEKASGKPYNTLLQDLVFAPLSLKHEPAGHGCPARRLHPWLCTCRGDKHRLSRPSVSAGPEDVSQVINPTQAWASGGMISTTADMNTFMRGYVAGNCSAQACVRLRCSSCQAAAVRRAGNQLQRTEHLSLRDTLRHLLRPHGEHARLHRLRGQ